MASVKNVKEGEIFNYFKDTEEYWVFQIKDGDKICRVKSTTGDSKLKGIRSGNLKRHLQRAHSTEKLLLHHFEEKQILSCFYKVGSGSRSIFYYTDPRIRIWIRIKIIWIRNPRTLNTGLFV